ncbi:MAG TPA: LuxR C-terminal-related transcriptional regulator, partial [Synergistaceae bacterium]|nr:LuxR C-terminal-related transcriptional regulator [Synergistaceae bacterium]
KGLIGSAVLRCSDADAVLGGSHPQGGMMLQARAQEYRPQIHYYSSRLKKRLEQIRQFRTTFIEAPSGAGKTTAVRDFFENSEMKKASVRWFVASEEPQTSGWMRFCRVLTEIDPSGGSRLLRLGLPVEENQGEIAQALRELRCDVETYLVCDNFQFLQKNLPGAVWRALVDHGGKGLRILILTRQLSSRGLVVLSNAEVLRIENEDLCLGEEEIGEYYRMAGVELEKEQMRNLHRYSEGWIAALYLQLIGFIRTGSLERRSSIYELVNELLWQGLSREERQVLFYLSPFDNFTVPQICFLLSMETLSEPLEEALNRWMFLRYDLESRRYFPHAILLDFVRLALLDEPESLRREILRRAGKWCARQGEKTQALNFFYSLEDYSAILSLDLRCVDLSRAILDSSREEMLDILRNIVKNATPELRRNHAFTLISMAFEAFTLGDMELYGRLCAEMKELLETCEMEEDHRRSLLGELYLATSFGFYNDIEKMGEMHQRAYELLGNESRLFRPDSPWTFGWPSIVGMYFNECGKLDTEMEQMDYWLPRYNTLTSGNGSGADVLFRAEVLLHRGFLDEAEVLALKALEITRRWNQDSLYICTAFLLQRVALLRGDPAGFQESASLLNECAHNSVYALSRRIADMAGGFTAILLNRPEDVPPWIRDGNFLKTLSPAVPFACMIYGRLLLLTGRERELLLRAQEFLAFSGKHRNLLAEIYVRLYISVARFRLGRNAEGAHALKEALDLALPDGLLLPFAENTDLLGASLKKVLFEQWPGEWQKLSELRKRYERGRESILQSLYEEHLPEGLTPREYEVALLVAEGKINRDIGEELFLSENTVKFYLKSIFQKLGIRSRREIKKILSKGRS